MKYKIMRSPGHIKTGDLVHLSCNTTHRGFTRAFENGIVVRVRGMEFEVYWLESNHTSWYQKKHLELLSE